jgi:hypothetical protein
MDMGINCISVRRALTSVPDLAGPDIIKFGIESKRSCQDTSTAHFKNVIADALRDMKVVCNPDFEKDQGLLSNL